MNALQGDSTEGEIYRKKSGFCRELQMPAIDAVPGDIDVAGKNLHFAPTVRVA